MCLCNIRQKKLEGDYLCIFHDYTKWEIDKNNSKAHLVVQKRTCNKCGITKYKHNTLPCNFTDYKEFEKGSRTQNGHVVGYYKKLEGTCNMCGKTDIVQRNH